jgi:hypothetical protein
MRRFVIPVLLFVFSVAALYAVNPDPSHPAVLVDDSGGDTRTLPMPVVGTMTANVTIATITAELAAGTNSIGSIGAIVSPLPAGTNAIGTVGLATGANYVGHANETPLATGSCTILATGLIIAQIASYPNRSEVSITNIATETVWIKPFATDASFPSGGIPLSAGDTWSGSLGAEVPISYVSSTTGSIAVIQGVRR